VEDVARGHLDALKWMDARAAAQAAAAVSSADGAAVAPPAGGAMEVFNFGTGHGTTVFELVHALERASGKAVPLVVGPRRDGDLAQSFCNPAKAERVLGWKAEHGLDRICVDAWKWQSNNPRGYDE